VKLNSPTLVASRSPWAISAIAVLLSDGRFYFLMNFSFFWLVESFKILPI